MSNKSLGKCVYCGNDLFSESVHACKPTYPDCGACSGDGAICKKSCKLIDESPFLQATSEQEHVAIDAQKIVDGFLKYHKQPEQEPVAWTVRRFYDDGTPHPCISLEWAGRNAEDDFPIGTKFFTAQPQRKPLDFGDFFEWANDEGYDTAHTHDGVKWVCLNPMTADLWKTWQAAHGIKGFV